MAHRAYRGGRKHKRYKPFSPSKSEYCAQQPLPPIEAYEPHCAAIQEFDEKYCPSCGLRWSIDEDRPTCLRERR